MADISSIQVNNTLYQLKDITTREKVDSLYRDTQIEISGNALLLGYVIGSTGEKIDFTVSGSDLVIG